MSLKTVLLAVGPSDSERVDALASTVKDLAGPAGATVVLAHVFSDDEFENAVGDLEFEATTDTDPDVVARRNATVRDLTDELTAADVSIEIRGEVGHPGDTIVSLANDVDADLVVIGGRKRSPTGKAVFGSTAQEVMLNSPVPVTFVRGE